MAPTAAHLSCAGGLRPGHNTTDRKSRIKEDNHLPLPAGHTFFDAAQDTVNLLELQFHTAVSFLSNQNHFYLLHANDQHSTVIDRTRKSISVFLQPNFKTVLLLPVTHSL